MYEHFVLISSSDFRRSLCIHQHTQLEQSFEVEANVWSIAVISSRFSAHSRPPKQPKVWLKVVSTHLLSDHCRILHFLAWSVRSRNHSVQAKTCPLNSGFVNMHFDFAIHETRNWEVRARLKVRRKVTIWLCYVCCFAMQWRSPFTRDHPSFSLVYATPGNTFDIKTYLTVCLPSTPNWFMCGHQWN